MDPDSSRSKPPSRQPANCDICGKEIAQKGDLPRHRWRVHFKHSTPPASIPNRYLHRTTPSGQPVNCDICGKTFSFKSDLPRHKRQVHFKHSNSLPKRRPQHDRSSKPRDKPFVVRFAVPYAPHSTRPCPHIGCVVCQLISTTVLTCAVCNNLKQTIGVTDVITPQGTNCVHPGCLVCKFRSCPYTDCEDCHYLHMKISDVFVHRICHGGGDKALLQTSFTDDTCGLCTPKGVENRESSAPWLVSEDTRDRDQDITASSDSYSRRKTEPHFNQMGCPDPQNPEGGSSLSPCRFPQPSGVGIRPTVGKGGEYLPKHYGAPHSILHPKEHSTTPGVGALEVMFEPGFTPTLRPATFPKSSSSI